MSKARSPLSKVCSPFRGADKPNRLGEGQGVEQGRELPAHLLLAGREETDTSHRREASPGRVLLPQLAVLEL